MPRLIHCPQCNADIELSVRPGERAVCGTCGHEVVVPAVATDVPVEAAEGDLEDSVEARGRPPDAEVTAFEHLVKTGRLNPASARLYTLSAIGFGTTFGGLLGGAILASRNYIAFGDEETARRCIWLGIVGTMLVFAIATLIPKSAHVPAAVYPAVQVTIALVLIKRTQGARITAHKRLGGAFYSKWRAAGIGTLYGLLEAVVFVGAWMLVVMLTPTR